jgi:hypothetical protein
MSPPTKNPYAKPIPPSNQALTIPRHYGDRVEIVAAGPSNKKGNAPTNNNFFAPRRNTTTNTNTNTNTTTTNTKQQQQQQKIGWAYKVNTVKDPSKQQRKMARGPRQGAGCRRR